MAGEAEVKVNSLADMLVDSGRDQAIFRSDVSPTMFKGYEIVESDSQQWLTGTLLPPSYPNPLTHNEITARMEIAIPQHATC
jgi:hypothetical protein